MSVVMTDYEPKPGWLRRAMEDNAVEVATWPAWMRRDMPDINLTADQRRRAAVILRQRAEQLDPSDQTLLVKSMDATEILALLTGLTDKMNGLVDDQRRATIGQFLTGWFAAYPGSEKLDIGDKRPIAFFQFESHADDYTESRWPGIGYVEPAVK